MPFASPGSGGSGSSRPHHLSPRQPPPPPLTVGRLVAYALLAMAVYAFGYLHGASSSPVMLAADTAAAGAADSGAEGGNSNLRLHSSFSSSSSSPVAQRGSARSLDVVQFSHSNHEPDERGRYIEKQVMIPPGAIPQLTGFSRAVLRPTQMVQRHAHATMHEVFFVASGHGIFLIDDVPHPVSNGSFVHLPPKEPHAMLNSAQGDDGEDLVLLYFGVAAD